MLRAVTNRDFPMLRQSLKSLFGMELDYDPSLKVSGKLDLYRMNFSSDPHGRLRILFIDNTRDLSWGFSRDADVTGRSNPHAKIAMIAVPDEVTPVTEKCRLKTGTIDGFLLVVTLHELYEVITGDFDHCDNPCTCINSECEYFDVGTCSACMGALIDEKFPDLKLEDIYCPEHLRNLRRALKNGN